MSNGFGTSMGSLVAFPGTANGRAASSARMERTGKDERPGRDRVSKGGYKASKRKEREKSKGSGKGSGDGSGKGKRKSVAEKVSSLMKTPALIMGPRLAFIISVVILCVLGLIMIYSASSVEAYASAAYGHDATYFLKRQCIWVLLGGIICAVVAKIPYTIYSRFEIAAFFWAVTIALLAAVQFLGNTTLGASRSLSLGGFDIQPAEFAKVTTVIFLAIIYQGAQEGRLNGIRALIGGIGVGLVTIGLIYVQPDLGTIMILMVGVFSLFVLLGLDAKILWGIVVVIIGLFLIICIAQPYHLERFASTWFADSDPQGDGYQSVQGFRALANGGIFGVGFGLSRQKYDYLPYAYNDFIFAVIGEELGLVGALFVVLLFLLFLYAGLKIARMAPDPIGMGVSGALVCMIVFQAFLNMLCIVGIAPVTGKALPFLSYGGSSLIATMMMVGIVLSVSLNSRLDVRYEKRRDNLRVMDGGAARDRGGQQQQPAASGGLGQTAGSVAALFGSAAERVRNRGGNGESVRNASSSRRSRSAEDEFYEDDRRSSRRTREQDDRYASGGRTHGYDAEAGSSRVRGYADLETPARGGRSRSVSYGSDRGSRSSSYSDERDRSRDVSYGRERGNSRSGARYASERYSSRDDEQRSACSSRSGRDTRSDRDMRDDEGFNDEEAPKGRLSYSSSAHRSSGVTRPHKPRKPRY